MIYSVSASSHPTILVSLPPPPRPFSVLAASRSSGSCPIQVQTAQSQLQQAQAAAVAAQQQQHQAYSAATLNAVNGMRAAAAYGAASVPQQTAGLNYAVAAG